VERPIILLGQTASGKHEAAERVADRLGCRLISIDSMKVYRGMDIGTAKPRRRTEYRLIDICDPSESYNAGRFVRDARAAMAEGPRPLLVGGTALYYKALAYGLFEGPSADPALREELVALGAPALHAELRRVDPAAAARIHPNDLKRLVRAVEVYRKTGEPISARQTQFARRTLEADVFAIRREDLRDRIAARTRRMLEEGLVEEVRRLRERPWGAEGRRAVGYREVIGYLEGRYDAAEMERLINRNTMRLARHQAMWFRTFPEVQWVSGADEILERLR
jgi:tRNA dimethylallyltransferase